MKGSECARATWYERTDVACPESYSPVDAKHIDACAQRHHACLCDGGWQCTWARELLNAHPNARTCIYINNTTDSTDSTLSQQAGWHFLMPQL